MKTKAIWFEPKRYGYGAGLPTRWKGWALTGSFIACVGIAAATLASNRRGLFVATLAPLTIGFASVVERRTRGGWHWRWGGTKR